MVNGALHGHVWCKDFCKAASDLEKSMSIEGLEHEPMPWVQRDSQQIVDGRIGSGNVHPGLVDACHGWGLPQKSSITQAFRLVHCIAEEILTPPRDGGVETRR